MIKIEHATDPYDSDGFVRRDSLLVAAGMKIASYRVRRPDYSYTSRQFHFTWDNTVMAVLPESVALAFVQFFDDSREAREAPDGLQIRTTPEMEFALERRKPSLNYPQGEPTYLIFYHEMALGVLGPEAAEMFCRQIRQAACPFEPQYAGAES